MAVTCCQNELESCLRSRARELFKISRSQVFCWCLHNERMFMHICLYLDDDIIPWESNNPSDFVVQNFLDSRLLYKTLKGLMDFLTFLVQKLGQNKQKLIREITWNYSAYSLIIWGFLALAWHQKCQEVDLDL